MAATEMTTSDTPSPGPQAAGGKLRTILVSTVYLETSATIDHALELAKLPGTRFVLLHVLETPRAERHLGALASEETQAKLEGRRRQALEHLASVCKRFQAAGVPCAPKVRIGVPHDEILDEAAEIGPDLIVVGSTSGPAFTRFLLGSTAERVTRHARCSVFVARERPPEQGGADGG
jgi:nucleotide-binding universal stress UspA family protein